MDEQRYTIQTYQIGKHYTDVQRIGMLDIDMNHTDVQCIDMYQIDMNHTDI
ncbi:hypothetical protein D3C76_494280 [compost metagenome]